MQGLENFTVSQSEHTDQRKKKKLEKQSSTFKSRKALYKKLNQNSKHFLL